MSPQTLKRVKAMDLFPEYKKALFGQADVPEHCGLFAIDDGEVSEDDDDDDDDVPDLYLVAESGFLS